MTGPLVSRSFTESSVDLVNPERGLYIGLDLIGGEDAARVRTKGHALAIALVRLDAFRDGPIDAAFLTALRQGFGRVRAAGIKVVLRFTYNSAFTDDAPRDVILNHIAQLKPVLRENADVIAVLQAGFIGAWGEWHSSTHGLDNDADRGAILNALLAALPPSRSVQVRTPMFKAAAFPAGPMGAADAYDGSPRSRVGGHNDCFLASASDLGTYASPIADWQAYVASDSQFTPMGGETCAVFTARTNCETTLAEMAKNHWSYLNLEYNPDVIAGWRSGGCMPQIQQRLGYRFTAQQVRHSEAVAPGGMLDLEVAIANRGFAAPFNARPVYAVLTKGTTRLVARLGSADPRRWAPGQVTRVTTRLRIPASAAAGTYSVRLWLPDDAEGLRGDPRYAVRFANDGLFDEATGDHVLSQTLKIDPAAPGAVDTAATAFVEIH